MSPAILSRRDRRRLVIGVGVMLLTVIGGRGVPALLAWERSSRASATALVRELARARATIRTERAASESLVVRERRFVALAPKMLAGDTPAATGATLVGILSGAAARSDVRLGAIQIQDATGGDSTTFRPVLVTADATGDVRGLATLLELLETGPPFVAVRRLEVTQPEPAGAADQSEKLRIAITVEGVALVQHARQERDD